MFEARKPERQRQHRYRKTVTYDLEITMEGPFLLIDMDVVKDQTTTQYMLQL